MDNLTELEELQVELAHAEALLVNAAMDYHRGVPQHILMHPIIKFEQKHYE